MKKLTAILFACMMLTCTFTACGKGGGSSRKTDVSASGNNSSNKTEPSSQRTLPSISIEKPTPPSVNLSVDFVGSWESVLASENGYQYIDEINGVSVKGLFRIEAFEDGTGYAEFMGEKETFTWEKKAANKFVITSDSDGEKDEIAVYGKRFVMADDELKITFEKSDNQ